MQQKVDSIPASDHFDLFQLTKGVYAAIATPLGAATSNAGIIDLGRLTLIFDTFQSPKAANDLRLAAEKLTGRTPDIIINSHHHSDHWFGNQVFTDTAVVISTHNTRDQMVVYAEEMKQLKQDPEEIQTMLDKNLEQLAFETDPIRRTPIERSINRLKVSLETLPILDLHLPDQTFEKKMVFHGANTSAELVAFGEAHTHGDCCLILSKEKIAFLGDLAFFQGQPYMNDCNPLSWKTILDEISRVGVKVFIPGHGQPGTKSEILLLSEYLTSMVNLVSQIIHEGGSVEDALKCSLPAPFHLWQNSGRHLFEDNVRFLYQCMRNRDEF